MTVSADLKAPGKTLRRSLSLTLALGLTLPLAAQAPAPEIAAPAKVSKKAAKALARQHDRDAEAAEDSYLNGAHLLERKKLTAAEAAFRRAAQLDPTKREYLLAAEAMRQARVTQLVQQAGKDRILGKDTEANALLAQARTLDPSNTFLQQHPVPGSLMAATAPRDTGSWIIDGPRLAGAVELHPKDGTQSFHIHSTLQDAIRQVTTAFGIHASFDDAVKNTPVRFDLDDVTYDQAIRVLEQMGPLFVVPMDSTTALFAPDTADKRASLEHLLQETLYLQGMSTSELNEVGNMIRNVFEIKQINMANNFDTVVVRGSAESIRVLNLTLADLLQGTSQIVFDLKLYTIAKTSTRNIGVTVPTQIGAYSVASEANALVQQNQTIVNQAIAQGIIPSGLSNIDIAAALIYYGLATSPLLSGTIAFVGNGLGATGIYSPNLSAQLNLALSASDTHALDDVQLRADDRQMATFKVGSRYPITQSTYTTTTPTTGTTGLTSATIGGVSVSSLLAQATTATVPQIQYEDLGLVLKATPNVGRYGQVGLHLDLSITALQGTSIDNIPILNSTLFTSDISVQDGATAMLVTDLTRNQAAAVTGIPGLSDLPGFQDTTNDLATVNDSQLVMILTPHIVRHRVDEAVGPRIPIRVPASTPE